MSTYFIMDQLFINCHKIHSQQVVSLDSFGYLQGFILKAKQG